MHIPDGYLSPFFVLGTGVVTVPTWALAVRRVQRVLSHRTLPLLSFFSALSFVIMLVHIPVPGGTTAHVVGGTFIAILLGPWAAVLSLTTALVIQALFFGDGGVLAIFTNSLNLAIILPFVGYYTYVLLAGCSPLLSRRRVWAAGIGAYLGLSISALVVGCELGMQPLLFAHDGRGFYIPYSFGQTLPAMLISHVFGAALVEALITAFGIAYLQKHHPHYLSLLVNTQPAGSKSTRNVLIGVSTLSVVSILVFGYVSNLGGLQFFFGGMLTRTDWDTVLRLLLVSLLLVVFFLLLVRLVWAHRTKEQKHPMP